MQSVSIGDNLYEISNLFSWENMKNIVNLSSAELAQRVVKVKMSVVKTTGGFKLILLVINHHTTFKFCKKYNKNNNSSAQSLRKEEHILHIFEKHLNKILN